MNDLVQSVSTIALVLVTIYYAWQTRQTVKELNYQRTLGVRPVLVIKSLILQDKNAHNGKDSCIKCELENIGNGPALKIHVGIYNPKTNEQIATSSNFIDYLTKDGIVDDSHIHIKNKKFEEIEYKENEKGEMFARLKLVLHYKDFYDNLHFSERQFHYDKESMKFNAISGSFELKSKTIEKVKKRFYSKWNSPAFWWTFFFRRG